jgi:hypothetical protein
MLSPLHIPARHNHGPLMRFAEITAVTLIYQRDLKTLPPIAMFAAEAELQVEYQTVRAHPVLSLQQAPGVFDDATADASHFNRLVWFEIE